MKVKTLNRNEEEYTRERSQDLKKVHRNYDPAIHQFQVRTACGSARRVPQMQRAAGGTSDWRSALCCAGCFTGSWS
jgi:hypothetical protein